MPFVAMILSVFFLLINAPPILLQAWNGIPVSNDSPFVF